MLRKIIIVTVLILTLFTLFISTRKAPNLGGDKLEMARNKIKHVIIIVQQNRSFDQYFGTYPGVTGIPMENGTPAVCIPNPKTNECVRPYHNTTFINEGGPTSADYTEQDINGGKMDGFVRSQLEQRNQTCRNIKTTDYPGCGKTDNDTDVMGYYTRDEIPNYWTYADNFVLQDNFFASGKSWSLSQALFLVSGWSAKCDSSSLSCVNDLSENIMAPNANYEYAWTDITYLLNKKKVTWAFYYGKTTPGIWNPLGRFQTVRMNNRKGNIRLLSDFYEKAKDGNLPQVSWVVPADKDSEHPPASVKDGQAHVTSVINAVMRSPNWQESVILLTWDHVGGFYDHVPPPSIDENGYGPRIPGFVISPYAKKGHVDHQLLSHDAYLKFIEDIFLEGQRLDPKTDGRPDKRPTVRENVAALGNLINDLDFSKPPRPALILTPYPN